MRHLRSLFESVGYAHGQYAPEIVLQGGGERYERLIPNRGPGYAIVYAYTSQAMTIDLAAACPGAERITAEWFLPSDGSTLSIGTFPAEPQSFEPETPTGSGNDIVLLLRDAQHDRADRCSLSGVGQETSTVNDVSPCRRKHGTKHIRESTSSSWRCHMTRSSLSPDPHGERSSRSINSKCNQMAKSFLACKTAQKRGTYAYRTD